MSAAERPVPVSIVLVKERAREGRDAYEDAALARFGRRPSFLGALEFSFPPCDALVEVRAPRRVASPGRMAHTDRCALSRWAGRATTRAWR